MRYILVAFLFCLTSSIANAEAFESLKPVVCAETAKVIKSLNDNYGEKPVWIAKDTKGETRYSLFVNEKKNSWTMIQFTAEVACVIGVGTDSKLVLGNRV